MAILVEMKRTKDKYFLVGTGFGMYKSTRPSFLGGNLFPDEEEGVTQAVALCDERGEVIFCEKDEIRVLEIDGINLEEFGNILDKDRKSEEIDYCPACNGQVSKEVMVCPHCGIVYR